jgi:trimeric autotransporter adhesin
MKNAILYFILMICSFSIQAQIFIQRSSDESITITPRGINSKFGVSPATANTILGAYAGMALNSTTGSGNYNTAIGYLAQQNTTTGHENTSLGMQSMLHNTSGGYNVGLGQSTLITNKGNDGSTAVGFGSMAWCDDREIGRLTYNSALGYYAMKGSVSYQNNFGRFNTAVGAQSIFNITSGDYNIGLGYYSLYSNSNGSNNVALGANALSTNSEGNRNISVGNNSLKENTNGSENIALGYEALYQQSTDNYIVTIGSEKLTQNMAIGYQALYNTNPNNQIIPNGPLGNGTKNLGLGYKVLYNNIRGEQNTIIGYQAGFSNLNGNRNVFLGYQAGYNHDADDMLVIENSNSNQALIRGDFSGDKVGINRLKSDLDNTNFTFQVNGDASKNTAGNWASHSDRRLKKNITYLNSQEILQKVSSLKGVTYEWNDTQTGTKRPEGVQFGFIAQELKEVFPTKIQEDKNGFLIAAYGDYDPMIVESIKALKEMIEEQKSAIEELSKTVKNQQKEINTLKAQY